MPNWDEGKKGHFHRSRLQKGKQSAQIVFQNACGVMSSATPCHVCTKSRIPHFPPGLVNKLCYTFSRKTLKRGKITAHWDRVLDPFLYNVVSIRMEISSCEKGRLLESLTAMLSMFNWTPELSPVACSKFMYTLKCREIAVYEDFLSCKDPACDIVADRFESIAERLNTLANTIHWRAYLWYSVLQVEICDSMRLSGWNDSQIAEIAR